MQRLLRQSCGPFDEGAYRIDACAVGLRGIRARGDRLDFNRLGAARSSPQCPAAWPAGGYRLGSRFDYVRCLLAFGARDDIELNFLTFG